MLPLSPSLDHHTSYFQNVIPLFNPFLTSAGRVTGYFPDPSGSRAFSIEVTVFPENHTSLTLVGYDASFLSFEDFSLTVTTRSYHLLFLSIAFSREFLAGRICLSQYLTNLCLLPVCCKGSVSSTAMAGN